MSTYISKGMTVKIKRKRKWPVAIRNIQQNIVMLISPEWYAVQIDPPDLGRPIYLSPHQSRRLIQAVHDAIEECSKKLET